MATKTFEKLRLILLLGTTVFWKIDASSKNEQSTIAYYRSATDVRDVVSKFEVTFMPNYRELQKTLITQYGCY
jgi:hypothetical protein